MFLKKKANTDDNVGHPQPLACPVGPPQNNANTAAAQVLANSAAGSPITQLHNVKGDADLQVSNYECSINIGEIRTDRISGCPHYFGH